MKVILFQENLARYILIAQKALPAKTASHPVLSNFLLQVKKGEIKVIASNLETTITTVIPGKILNEGEVLIPAKTLLSFLPSLSGEKITITSNDKMVKLEGKATEVDLKTEEKTDFPIVSIADAKTRGRLSKGFIKDVVEKVCFSASLDEARAVLTGVLIKKEEKETAVVATDGFRLSCLSKKTKEEIPWKEMIVPAKVLFDVFQVLKESEDKDVLVFLNEEKTQVSFSIPGIEITTRTIEGSFPDYQKIIPQGFETKIIFSREELLRAVRLASVFAREAANIIKLGFASEEFYVSSSSPQSGENKTKLDVKVEGDKKVEIAFNYRFLADLLNSSQDEEVVFETSGSLAPGVFKFPKSPDFLHIIMPVRLQEG